MQRPGFWPAVVLALLGHGAVLGYIGTRPPQRAPQGAAGARVVTVQVRAVQPANRDLQPAPAAASPEPDRAPSQAAEAPDPAEEADPPETLARVQPSAPTVDASVPPPQQPASAPEPPYIPRGELTVAPKLLSSVQVPFPEDVGGIVDLTVQVTLFIDEKGAVQRIRVDTPHVHPAFERALQETFGAARFAPGELHQVPVRSQVRLEVAFQAAGSGPSAGSRRSRS